MQNRKNNRLNIWWISETLLKNRSFATPLLIQKIDRFRGFIIGITIGQEIGVRVNSLRQIFLTLDLKPIIILFWTPAFGLRK